MTATLVKSQVRMSPSMLSGEQIAEKPAVESDDQPLAYLYADWNPPVGEELPTEMGHYDPESQTWELPPGTITAGVWTRCMRQVAPGVWVPVVDDACV